MRALVCHKHGTAADLELRDWPDPSIEPNEIRIAVKACGINFPDVLMIAGRYQVQPDLPFIPGAELAGEIIEVGDAVKNFTVGQRVLAMCGHGAVAEQICVPAEAALLIPENMSWEQAAGFILTYSTSYHALKQRAQLQPGETLLVTGAAGGVGLTAVELGHLAGAKVIAAASSQEKLDLAAEYGAAELINYSDESLLDRLREITGGKGADVIYDPVGGDLFDQLLRGIAWNGRILVIGFAAGDIQKIPANLPLLKGSSVVGVFWGRFAKTEPAAQAENTRELLAHFAAGQLRPHVSQVFTFDKAADAIACLAERRAMGKVIVKI
ncbi:MAG: NADPH:quinone oxidoreductase family protein [Woeseia sp.]|nr:NADPH:quinone oxidoreductase family protein [Woeseia sp.]